MKCYQFALHKELASLDFLTFGKFGTFRLFKQIKGQSYPLGVSLFHSGGNTIYIESCMACWIPGWNHKKGEFLKCH